MDLFLIETKGPPGKFRTPNFMLLGSLVFLLLLRIAEIYALRRGDIPFDGKNGRLHGYSNGEVENGRFQVWDFTFFG